MPDKVMTLPDILSGTAKRLIRVLTKLMTEVSLLIQDNFNLASIPASPSFIFHSTSFHCSMICSHRDNYPLATAVRPPSDVVVMNSMLQALS